MGELGGKMVACYLYQLQKSHYSLPAPPMDWLRQVAELQVTQLRPATKACVAQALSFYPKLEAAFTVYAVTTDTLFLCDALQGLCRRINTYKGANHSHGQYSQGLQPMTIFQNFCIHDGLQVLELIQTIGASDYSA